MLFLKEGPPDCVSPTYPPNLKTPEYPHASQECFFMLSLGGRCQALGKGVGKTDKGAPGEEAWDTENLVGSWWFFLCSVVP